MTTHICYSTFATALITTKRGNIYERNFYESHELEWFKNWAQEAIDGDMLEIRSAMISLITFIDSKTGEILLECRPTIEGPTAVDDWDDWDFNEDEGYDPYLGCYTDDC